jgi:hypothetical protein
MANCDINVNSTHNDAMTVVGRTTLLSARKISIVGGIANGGTVTPDPILGASPMVDPLAAYSPPAFGACTYTSVRIYDTTQTINPGVYCGGILIRSSPTITFNPGIYYIVGGGLKTTSNATLIGSNVTFVNSYKAGYNYDSIDIGGNGSAGSTINLAAPITGPTKGILFFNDRTAVSRINNIGWPTTGGNTLVKLTGVLYFPTMQLNYQSGSITDAGTYTYIIAYDLNMIGNSLINYSSGAPIQISSGSSSSSAVTLVE